MQYFFHQIKFYIKFCLDNNYLTSEEVISAFPSKKAKFKTRIRQIVYEIKEKGTFVIEQPGEEIVDDLPF